MMAGLACAGVENEPDPERYDPGLECDDEGGMSEYRYILPEDYEGGSHDRHPGRTPPGRARRDRVLVADASLVSFADSYRGLFEWAHEHGLSGLWAAAWPLQSTRSSQ